MKLLRITRKAIRFTVDGIVLAILAAEVATTIQILNERRKRK